VGERNKGLCLTWLNSTGFLERNNHHTPPRKKTFKSPLGLVAGHGLDEEGETMGGKGKILKRGKEPPGSSSKAQCLAGGCEVCGGKRVGGPGKAAREFIRGGFTTENTAIPPSHQPWFDRLCEKNNSWRQGRWVSSWK